MAGQGKFYSAVCVRCGMPTKIDPSAIGKLPPTIACFNCGAIVRTIALAVSDKPLVPPTEQLKDEKFQFVRCADTHLRLPKLDEHHEALRTSIEAFIENLRRVDSLVSFLFYLVSETARYASMVSIAREKVGIPATSVIFGHEKQQEAEAELHRLSAEQTPEKINSVAHRWFGRKQLDDIIGLTKEPDDGLLALMSAQMIGAWTAFETLATDLWVAAVNHRPQTLGVNALTAPRRGLDALEKSESESTVPKRNPVSLDTLLEYQFDLRSRLGEMIWRKGQFDFNSLDGLKNAFFNAFCFVDKKSGKRHAPNEVKNWFEGNKVEGLRLLESLRHVLVHRGGRADKQFLHRVQNLRPELAKLEVGSRIPLDGPLVAECVDAMSARANILLEGVSKWLKQPEK